MRIFKEFMDLSLRFKFFLILIFCLSFYVTHSYLMLELVAFYTGDF